MKWSIPEKIIERGRSYLNSGRVLTVEPDYQNKVWHAEVLGTEKYYVTLDGTAKEEDFCQCPYWHEHHYCKHTIAVELYLRSKELSRVMRKEEMTKPLASQAKMFTKGFSRIELNEETKESSPLAAEFQVETIETNPYHPELALLGIQLRVGYLAQKNKFYVIKNIFDFLQAWQEETTTELNKQTISISKSAFDDETNAVLQTLNGIANSQQLLGVRGIPVKGKLDRRTLMLPVELGKSLLEEMNHIRRLRFKIDNYTWTGISFSKEQLPLSFTVIKQEEQYLLVVDGNFEHYFSHYQWGFLKGKIFSLSYQQQSIYMTLQQLMKRFRGNKVAYFASELPGLFKEVLPYLRKIGEVVVAPEILDEISDIPLESTMTFRKINQQIAVRVDSQYGETIYSTDSKYEKAEQSDKIILRDFKKENELKQVFLKFGFEEGRVGFTRALPNGQELFDFFTREIPIFRRYGDVRMGKKMRSLFLDAQHYQPKIAVSESDSWLDIRFDVTGISDNEIDQVMQSLLDHDDFYTLENGQVLSFESEDYQNASKFLEQIRGDLRASDGVIHVPKNQSLLIREKSLGMDISIESTTSFEQLTEDLLHPENFKADFPKGLQADLRPYQLVGFHWLKMLGHYHFGGILADEMGLGKTVQAISYLLSELEEKKTIKSLIVAPASLIYNWLAEFRKFAPEISAQVVAGSKEEREEQLKSEAAIFITSYASLRQDSETYQKMNFDHLILDEAQMVKNSATKTAQALRKLNTGHSFALSGTPVENNLEELWSLFQIIMPGFFPSRTKFRNMETTLIAQMIQPFVLRRDKQTVLKDLPEKIETNLYSALTEEQKTVYLAYLKQMQESINTMDLAAFQKNRINILAGLTRLRQICCDPALFIEDYQGGSGKLEQVKELVLSAKENHRRILLFSQFTSMLTILEGELNGLGIDTFYLRGSTKPKDRIDMVDAFNQGERDVFLISLKAGGTGLNLTGADTVILYDLWWNPAVEEQAAGRAHRIGQKNVVEVWRMIAEGTIEERMDLLQKEKRELFQQVIQGNQEQLNRMSEEDIRMILSIGEE